MTRKKKPDLEQKFFDSWKYGRPNESWELPVRQHRFDEKTGRLWRFDFAWLTPKVAIEVQGGQWIGGGHNTGSGMQKDCEKRNAATEQGWRVFYLTTTDLADKNIGGTITRVIEWLESAWNGSPAPTSTPPTGSIASTAVNSKRTAKPAKSRTTKATSTKS